MNKGYLPFEFSLGTIGNIALIKTNTAIIAQIADEFEEITLSTAQFNDIFTAQIMPHNQYLCIVRGQTTKAKPTVRLPFTGDTLLSIILSKAFMLANDDKSRGMMSTRQRSYQNRMKPWVEEEEFERKKENDNRARR